MELSSPSIDVQRDTTNHTPDAGTTGRLITEQQEPFIILPTTTEKHLDATSALTLPTPELEQDATTDIERTKLQIATRSSPSPLRHDVGPRNRNIIMSPMTDSHESWQHQIRYHTPSVRHQVEDYRVTPSPSQVDTIKSRPTTSQGDGIFAEPIIPEVIQQSVGSNVSFMAPLTSQSLSSLKTERARLLKFVDEMTELGLVMTIAKVQENIARLNDQITTLKAEKAASLIAQLSSSGYTDLAAEVQQEFNVAHKS